MTTTHTDPIVKWEPTTINGITYLWRAEYRNGGVYAFAYFRTILEADAWLADTADTRAADNADDAARKRGER